VNEDISSDTVSPQPSPLQIRDKVAHCTAVGAIIDPVDWPVRDSTPEREGRAPRLEENIWGYGKRLRFVDDAILRGFPQNTRDQLTVLDVGCGNGTQLAIPLAEAGYQVTAVDPHQQSIERGRRLAPSVRFHHGVVSDLAPRKFHCVIISEVLEHLDTPETLLRAALNYLTESGILIITVPNGYGEFELDSRLYRVLHVDKLVGWLWTTFSKNKDKEFIAGSDDQSPHVQRFTLPRLRRMFEQNRLLIVEARGTSLASGPFMALLLGSSTTFNQLNAAITDRLPLSFATGWMFSLRLAP
jgi:2-polyprenyl-3-methyl-5-hydroxy-6-metoxy-1,4-benzoquinol methylase